MEIDIAKAKIVSYKDFPMPELLYKYRDWDNEYHKKLVTDKGIFFAAPGSFEDEFDCKNPVRWDLLTDEEILNKYYNDSHSIHPEFTPEQRMEFAIGWANQTMIRDAKYIADQDKETFEIFNSFTGVLSLTEYPAETRMWEKYAASHTGFCIGFDAKTMLNGMGTGGGIVLYHEVLPTIHPSPKHAYIEQALLQIFNKLLEWNFEKEYRTFKFRNYPLQDEDRTVIVPPDAFRELILGSQFPKEKEAELKALIPDELKHMKIKKAFLLHNEIVIKDYEL